MKYASSIIALTALFFYSCSNGQGNQKIDANQFEKKLADSKEAILLDVRTPEEYTERHIDKALNIDYKGADFENKVALLDKTKPVFVYCLSGGRSSGAVDILSKKGFKTVYNLEGGILAWKAANKPVVESGTTASGLSMDEYFRAVNKSKLVLVDFNAVWCGPCKILKPIVEKVEKKHSDKVELLAIDVDKNNTLADAMHISSIPLLILYKNGKEAWRQLGLIEEKELEELILEKSK